MENKNEDNILLNAVKEGNFKLVKAQIKTKGDIESADETGCTPLIKASIIGHINIVRCLLKAGANVNAMDKGGQTPLIGSVKEGHLKIVKMLIAAGANFDTTDFSGTTPLNWACSHGHLLIVKYLLNLGADISNSNPWGYTPLVFVPTMSRSEGVIILMKVGTDIFEHPAENATYEFNKKLATYLMIRYFILQNPMSPKQSYVANSPTLSKYWDRCKVELQMLQTHLLGESTISLYKFLRESDLDKLAGYISNVSSDYPKKLWNSGKFKIYSPMIRDQFERARRRRMLLYKSGIVARHCDFEQIPPEIWAMITSQMTNTDLMNLIKSTEVTNTPMKIWSKLICGWSP